MSQAEQKAPLPAPKEDPETFLLRGRPRPVIRFRRGLIIGVSATAGAAFIGLAWAALEPPSFRIAAGEQAPGLGAPSAPESLADAPASYADVPQLGPPLPGDLGRPILDRQRKLVSAGDEPADAARAEAEQRLAEQVEAARTSAVIVRLASAQPTVREPAPAPPAEPQAEATPAASAGQPRKIDFAHAAPGDINPHILSGPPSPWTLSAGAVIPAALITGINSDLPGMVVAQVTEQVRDSATGSIVLIPQAARLIGAYDSMVAFGQKRALVVWHRIVFPDGSSLQLDNVPAADLAGYAGLEGKVDFHEWRLLKGIALSTLLGVGSELAFRSEDSDLVRAIERSVQRDGPRAGDQLVSRNLEVQPTLTIRPGWPVRAVIHKDLVLKPWKER